MFGTRHGVARNEMHALGDVRRDHLDHVFLDRSHIGDGRTGLEVRPDGFGHRPHGAQRHGKDGEVGIGDGRFGAVADGIAQTDLPRGLARGLGTGISGDMADQPAALHRPEHRGRDEAQSDQRDARVDRRLRHQRSPALNNPMQWATRRQAGSSPTVMRKADGNP